jgi:hypothetical protein
MEDGGISFERICVMVHLEDDFPCNQLAGQTFGMKWIERRKAEVILPYRITRRLVNGEARSTGMARPAEWNLNVIITFSGAAASS